MTRRSGLGRGLDALLPTSSPGPESNGRLRDIRTEEISPNPNQPRAHFDEASLEELAASITQLGVLQPLLVRQTDEGYELVAGERRLRAARTAGLPTVPVLVVEADDRGSMERALVENVHREDLNPLEEAEAYKGLLEEGGFTQEELGVRLGRNRTTIANALRLLELPIEVKAYLVDGRLSAGHGRALLGLSGNPFQVRLAKRAAQEGLSVRETEEHVKKYAAMTTGGARRDGARERPAEVIDAQRRLGEVLQTKVRVDMGARKGRIVVDFVSLEELERLMNVLLGSRAPTERISLD